MGAAASQDITKRANKQSRPHQPKNSEGTGLNSKDKTLTDIETQIEQTLESTPIGGDCGDFEKAGLIQSKMSTAVDQTMEEDNSEDEVSGAEVEVEPVPGKVPKQKKTLQDYQELMRKSIEKVTKCLEVIDEHYPHGEREKVDKALYSIRFAYSKLYGAPLDLIADFRYQIVKIIINHGKFIPIVCETIITILAEKNYYAKKDGDEETKKNWNVLEICLISTLNYTDCSDIMRDGFGKNDAFVSLVSAKLLEWWPAHQDEKLAKKDESVLRRIIGISHNLAMLESNVASMRNHGYVAVLVPYLNSRSDMLKLSAVATLADIVNEDECDLLNSNEDSIKFLLKKLGNASKKKNRRDAGWSAAELGRTVGRLARNDGNKKLLVTVGCLPLLLDLTTSKVKIEQEESIESLWVLAFDDDNKIKMVMETNMIDTIEKLQKSTVGKVKKLCNGIIWTLQKTLQGVEKYSHIVKIPTEDEVQPQKEKMKLDVKGQGHVMISYQWANQNTLKVISTSLREDKRQVWMDIDDMEGSTVQAMASAIESAKVVVICISQKYKDSPNCRAEAEYAFQLRRPIIPLIMEKGYRADGWLGFIVGAKLFYDFSGKYSFESRIEGLIKAVKQIYDPSEVHDGGPKVVNPQEPVAMDEVDSPVIQKQKIVPVGSSKPPSSTDDKIKKWTTHEVGLWLKKHNLYGNQRLHKLSGKEIVFLQNLREEAPEFFYHTLESKLGLQQLESLVDFSDAIQDVTI